MFLFIPNNLIISCQETEVMIRDFPVDAWKRAAVVSRKPGFHASFMRKVQMNRIRSMAK